MPEFLDIPDTQSLVDDLEEIATQFLLEEATETSRDRWVSSLALLSRNASTRGHNGVAAEAQTLAQQLMQESHDGDLAAIFESGLISLRAALDREMQVTPEPASQSAYSIAQDPELISDFVVESREHLESIEGQVLALDQDSTNIEAIHSIFRSFHTIKGLAGFLELPLIQEVAHEVETLLDQTRQGDRTVTPRLIDIVLESKDYLAKWVRHLEEARSGPLPVEISDNRIVLQHIRALSEGEAKAEPPTVEGAIPALLPEIIEGTPNGKSGDDRKKKTAGRSVKVDTDKLDHLVDMVGEMVIAQSLVRHDPDLDGRRNPRLFKNLAQLARITDDVQRTAMSMRMVPIGPLFQKMARLVRDLSRKFGKQVQFETVGDDVELDRNIVEELADPLMHMVRNSLDHGIESPADRAKGDKSPAARIELRAKHRSGYIVIEVIDDGRGIDREKVLAKARSKELITPNATPSDAEVFNLIFHPGFSTAEQVSDVSGRGVGMDVVKKQIQKLRGSIDIASTAGRGTTFSLKLPLTLAIIDGLVVVVGTERFIIPIASVKELLRPAPGMVSTVENRAEVISIRERLLPVMRLYKRFDIEPRSTDPTQCVFVVAEHEGTTFCLMVDEVIGKQEVVIKNLGRVFQRVTGVAGGAILGDGHVALILDVQGVFGGSQDV